MLRFWHRMKVLDLRAHETYKALRGAHANICAAVAFRPHRPWELLSGGLDGALVRWDFAAGRPQRTWQMADEAGPGSAQARGRAAPSAEPGGHVMDCLAPGRHRGAAWTVQTKMLWSVHAG